MQPSAGIRTAVSSPHKWNNIILHSAWKLQGGFHNTCRAQGYGVWGRGCFVHHMSKKRSVM